MLCWGRGKPATSNRINDFTNAEIKVSTYNTRAWEHQYFQPFAERNEGHINPQYLRCGIQVVTIQVRDMDSRYLQD